MQLAMCHEALGIRKLQAERDYSLVRQLGPPIASYGQKESQDLSCNVDLERSRLITEIPSTTRAASDAHRRRSSTSIGRPEGDSSFAYDLWTPYLQELL